MAYIKMNYPNVIEKVEELKQIAATFNLTSDKFETTTDDSRAYWKGEASNAYRREAVQLHYSLTKTAKRIDELAERIRQIADALNEVDENAADSADDLSTGD